MTRTANTTRSRSLPARRRPTRARRGRLAAVVGVHGALVMLCAAAVLPILIVVMNSFKTTMSIFDSPFAPPTAETFNVDGYASVLERGSFVLNYRNSIIVTLATIVLTSVLGTLAAYALVEYRVRWSGVLVGIFAVGIMLPIRLGTVPLLKTMISWHLIDTLAALVLVYTAMQLPLAIALMMTYFRGVPRELKEAARMDGAGELRTFGITLPIVRPGIAAVGSITMLPVWNDLWFPLILAPSKENQTVTLGVQQFVGQFQSDYPALLASLTLGALPLVVLFAVFSRQFIQGLSRGYGR
jgi:raffinose/stachyose/melibiose transport system permease protein